MAIHDFITTATPAREPLAALFAVILLVHTPGGQSYTLSDYEAMLAAAGFVDCELHEPPGLPTRLLTAAVA